MPLSTDLCLSPGHIVLDGDPDPLKGEGHSPQFSAHVCCGQTVGWIKMPLGTEVGLGQGHIVLYGDPAPPTERGTAAPPLFGFVYSGQTVARLSNCRALVFEDVQIFVKLCCFF